MRQQTSHRRSDFSDPMGTFERGRLSVRLLRDPRVPTWIKAAAPIVAMLYLFLPIDLIPDFILGLGQIDDLSVLGIAIFAMTKLIPKLAPENVVEEHLRDMRSGHGWSPRRREPVIDAVFTVDGESAPDSKQQRRNNTVWGNRA